MILAYETSTKVCSVAYQNNEGEVFEKRITGRSVHSDHVFIFTDELINEHGFSIYELDAVLVSNGPGSYTGLRIAASAIKGILFQQKVPLFACNTLAGFASGNFDENFRNIHAVIDARRTHLYHQAFKLNDSGTLLAQKEASVIEITDFEELVEKDDLVVGTGIQRVNPELLTTVTVKNEDYISAKNLISLYRSKWFDQFCKPTGVEELNPEYITSNQVNNSKT